MRARRRLVEFTAEQAKFSEAPCEKRPSFWIGLLLKARARE